MAKNENIKPASSEDMQHYDETDAMKGIVLAGGTGSRLFPCTTAVSKQMLNVYDKPMIYYSLSNLLLAGIRDILIISTPKHLPMYKELLGDGSELGVSFKYITQEKPRGLAEAFILGEDFIGKSPVALVLGDNIFYGSNWSNTLMEAANLKSGGIVFGAYVNNPEEFGVVSFAKDGTVLDIEEKPRQPKSNYAIPGIYFFDNNVIEIAKTVKPSPRGELEITSVMNSYLEKKQLKVKMIGRGTAWLDTGNPDALHDASQFVKITQKMTGLYVSCIEEICFIKKYIDERQLYKLSQKHQKTAYGKYLEDLALGHKGFIGK